MSDNLKWRDDFTSEVLRQSEDYVECIENVTLRGSEINANLKKSSHFFVYIHINNNEIDNMHCSCPKKSHCKHEAAVLTYVEKNNLLQKEKKFLNLVNSIDENLLKEYFIEIMDDNPQLKYEFIQKFKKEPKIDSKPYFDKLEDIIDRSKGSDYTNFGYYDIETLAEGIYDFILDEIYNLMDIHQYEIVFELLERMASVLNDEMYVDDSSWYDACEEYLQVAYKLEDTYILSDDQLDKLEDNTSFMRRHM